MFMATGAAVLRRRPLAGAPGRTWLGHDPSDLQVDDRVPVETDGLEDLVAVLVELGRTEGRGSLVAEPDRRGRELERHPLGRRVVLDVRVRRGLGIGRHLERV